MEFATEFLTATCLAVPVWSWLAFVAIVMTLLAFDLGLFNRHDHEIGIGESLWLSSVYIGAAVIFGFGVWHFQGAAAAELYFTGFLVEKSLSLDNVFVISLIFSFLAVPRLYQHRVLFWGILGALVMRGVLIGLGTALVHQFEGVLYLFAAFLLFTGVKMLAVGDHDPDLAGNPALRFARRHLRVTDSLHGHDFFAHLPDPARPGHRLWYATPLFLALLMVEAADLVFAVDSVPAILAITQDPFIVYTSNIFAILGLRALYFALAAMVQRFRYLKTALALILVFIGGKIIAKELVGTVPPSLALVVTAGLLLGGVLYSLWRTRHEAGAPAPPV